MKHLLSVITAFFVLGATNAQAGLLIEPYAGYHTGDFKFGSTKYDFGGAAYGGRLGYSRLGLQLGADYMAGKWTIDVDPSDFKGDINNLGAFIGYSFPILVRVYATYFFNSSIKDSNTKYEGNTTRLGVGFSPLPFVDINLEYMTGTYDKVDGQSISGTKPKFDVYGVSLSVPFDL